MYHLLIIAGLVLCSFAAVVGLELLLVAYDEMFGS